MTKIAYKSEALVITKQRHSFRYQTRCFTTDKRSQAFQVEILRIFPFTIPPMLDLIISIFQFVFSFASFHYNFVWKFLFQANFFGLTRTELCEEVEERTRNKISYTELMSQGDPFYLENFRIESCWKWNWNWWIKSVVDLKDFSRFLRI